MGLFGGSSSKSKPYFFPGQKSLAELLFGPLGPFASMLGGGPDPGYQAGVNRAFGQLNQNLSQQGLFGSPLGARAATDLATGAAVGAEQNRLQNLLAAIQPAGSKSEAGGGGILGLLGL